MPMLHFFPPGMAERYLLFMGLAVLGLLQLIAAHFGLVGLSIPGRRRAHWGYVLGGLLLGGAYGWFFWRVQPLIFIPGLAGAELVTLFALATVLAFAVTLGLVSLLHGRSSPRLIGWETLQIQGTRWAISRPQSDSPTRGAILLPDFPYRADPLAHLMAGLRDAGFLTLCLHEEIETAEKLEAVEEALPAVFDYMAQHLRADSALVIVGMGVGGDGALRIAACHPSVSAVVAVEPVLKARWMGIDLLWEGTYVEAWRWGRCRRRLVAHLAGLEALQRLPQPGLWVTRGSVALSVIAPQARIDVETATGTAGQVQCILAWLGKVLGNTVDGI